ncbi:MAG: glycosyltransferase family 9 protein [Luteimonas sp.]
MLGRFDHSLEAMARAFDLQQLRRRVVRNLLSTKGRIDSVTGGLPKKGIHRIVVLRPNHRLGNTLLLTPLISELEHLYPGAEVDILTAGGAASEVFARHDSVRNLWILPNRLARHPLASWRTIHRMHRQHYDMAIDPCLGSQSGRVFLSIVKAKHKLGFEQFGMDGGVTCHIPVPQNLSHMGQLPVYLLRRGCKEDYAARDCPRLDVRLSSEELRQGSERLRRLLQGLPGNEGPVIALFGEATGSKAFPEGWWIEMIQRLQHLRPDHRFIEIIPASGTSKFNNAYPVYYSTSVRRMSAVMAASSFVVSADCGVMHLAAASGVATAGIFRVTKPLQYGPYGGRNFFVSAEDKTPVTVAEDVDRRWAENDIVDVRAESWEGIGNLQPGGHAGECGRAA